MTFRAIRLGLALAFFAVAIPAHADITNRANYAAILLDSRGQVLHQANADEPRFPASLTKMMTLYMLFEAMRDGRVQPDARITMSAEAATRPPSKLGLPAGYSLALEDAILAVVTRSANDVAAAIAEHLGGTEERFAQMMTQRARSLGMTRSTFRNASGLPDAEQRTTARDMALLGSRLQADFPRQYAYFSTTAFRWNNRQIHNHNHMLSAYDGMDGIKTGYTRWSGFNIVTSARRDGVRLIGAVMGGSSWVERDRHMAELMDDGFQRVGVARRANSYDVMQTNRGSMAREAQPRAPAVRMAAQPRVMASAPPVRPVAQPLVRGPRQPPTVLTSSSTRPPATAQQQRQATTPAANRPAQPARPMPRPAVAQEPRPLTPAPGRPVTRT
ncbi:serine hydrolase [Rhodovarius sp.]|uniref:D-alanyl-D-alanine carboxypeptidase family protein n=1 Tax=Rhodovarius sp. TaxID=2972673 RepID=UPI0034A0E091